MHKLIIAIILIVIVFFTFVYAETKFPFTKNIALNQFANSVYDVTFFPFNKNILGISEDPLARLVYGGKK